MDLKDKKEGKKKISSGRCLGPVADLENIFPLTGGSQFLIPSI